MQPPWVSCLARGGVSGANLACRCVHSTPCTTHDFPEAAHQLCNIVCVIMCDSLVHILMAVPRSCLMLLRQNLKHKSAVPCSTLQHTTQLSICTSTGHKISNFLL